MIFDTDKIERYLNLLGSMESISQDGSRLGVIKSWMKRTRHHRDKSLKDSLGCKYDSNRPQTFTLEKNESRGLKALHRSINQGKDVKKAMFTPELGWIDFDYGTPGNPQKEFQNGWGISHILTKHSIDVSELVNTIARGKCYKLPREELRDGSKSTQRYCVVYGRNVAFLDRRGKNGSFCVTQYQKDSTEKYMKYPLAEPRGSSK